MAKSACGLAIKVGLLALLLSGCTVTPERILLGVDNDYIGRGTLCTGGLEASLTLQGARVESGVIAPGETISVDLITPEGAAPGTIMTTEARCYEGDEEIGYIKIEEPYKASSIPTVDIIAPPAEGEANNISCAEPTEAQGVTICVESQLYR